MNSTYSQMVEVSEIIDQIKLMKDRTLDHFYEDKTKARQLLVGLNDLEDDANKLIRDFESLI